MIPPIAKLALVALFAAATVPSAAQEAVVKRPDPSAGSTIIPCDGLPPGAVRAVPPPFDRYMELACTWSGQALKPVKGYIWQFPQGPMWLVSADAGRKTDHFAKLENHPLSAAEKSALMAELGTIADPKRLAGRDIIRLDVTVSTGDHRQEYLLLPPAGAGAGENVLGMECIHDCKPIATDPWFFVVAPAP